MRQQLKIKESCLVLDLKAGTGFRQDFCKERRGLGVIFFPLLFFGFIIPEVRKI